MKYNFEIKRGCIVYKDGGKVVLFDTGCVQTISAKQDVYGKIFPKVNKFVDPTVDQILGMDLINQRVFIDYPKKELVYGEKSSVDSPIAKYDLDVVAFGSKLHLFYFLASYDWTDVWLVDAHDTIRDAFFGIATLVMVALLTVYLRYRLYF